MLLKRELVYGIYGKQQQSLVFLRKLRAIELRTLWAAITKAKTWNEFKGMLPAATYAEAVDALSNEDINPTGNDFFDFEEASAQSEWPTNPMDDMEQLLPREALALSNPVHLGEFRTFDIHVEAEVVSLLQGLGWQLQRDDILIKDACGLWQM